VVSACNGSSNRAWHKLWHDNNTIHVRQRHTSAQTQQSCMQTGPSTVLTCQRPHTPMRVPSAHATVNN
jgi:hypothetical protein